jgi:hypothetical protein
MNARHKDTWTTMGVLGMVLQIAGKIAWGAVGGMVGLLVLSLGTVLLLVAMARYAKAKGRNPAWCLLGLIGVIGVIPLHFLKDKSVEAPDNDSNRTEALVATLRARTPLAGGRVKALDDALVVHQDRDPKSPPVGKVPPGTEINLGPVTEVDGREWVEAGLPDGTQGLPPPSKRPESRQALRGSPSRCVAMTADMSTP